MAFLDDSDLAPKPAPAPVASVAVVQAAPRSKLVPVLLIALNVMFLVIILLIAGPKIEWPAINFGGKDAPAAVADAGALDPWMLVTPSGRTLDTVVFGNAIFEVTRVTYYPDVRSRSVTITVPGKPPAQAVFRVGESFAGGKIRVVDIQPAGAMLEADGQQKLFGIEGSSTADQWDRPAVPSGTTMIPAKGNSLVPDLPPGQARPALDPRLAPEPKPPVMPEPETEPTKPTEGEAEPERTLEDLPLETYVDLERREFEDLLVKLADIFSQDFVFATAIEADTRIPFGLEIKNLRSTSVLAAYLRKGDIILNLNDDTIIRVADIDLAARQVRNAIELRIDIQREDTIETYILRPGNKK